MGKACVVLRIIINKHNNNREKETERKQQGLPFETTDLKKSVLNYVSTLPLTSAIFLQSYTFKEE